MENNNILPSNNGLSLEENSLTQKQFNKMRVETIREFLQESISKKSETIFISGSGVLKSGSEEVPKLWDPMFNQVGTAGLIGSSDCGKSTLMRELCQRIIAGEKDYLGFRLNIRFQRAMYVSTEDNIQSMSPSLSKQIKNKDEKILDNLTFVFNPESDIYERIEAELQKNDYDIIVVDTWVY